MARLYETLKVYRSLLNVILTERRIIFAPLHALFVALKISTRFLEPVCACMSVKNRERLHVTVKSKILGFIRHNSVIMLLVKPIHSVHVKDI